jgi:NADPH:quinone reductase-like Zn-dependent oxidoreductase
MKAVVCTKYGPPEVLQLAEVEKPVPRRNEVCVRIVATNVTASDCIIRGFKLPRWSLIGFMMGLALGWRRPRQPILGLVLAGDVESVGEDVKEFREGDKVYGMTGLGFGAYAEYDCLSQKDFLVKMPSNASYEEAASAAYGGMLAGHFLKKGDIQSRKKVLIYGASGSIGTTAVQLAKHYGAEVTGVCSTRNLEMVRSLGADAVIDYTKDDLESMGERYDLVLDAVGERKSSKLKKQSKRALTENGTYVSVDDGGSKNRTEYLVLLNELIEAGGFKVVIDRSYPLEQIVEAHRYVEKGHKKGNVVITVKHD